MPFIIGLLLKWGVPGWAVKPLLYIVVIVVVLSAARYALHIHDEGVRNDLIAKQTVDAVKLAAEHAVATEGVLNEHLRAAVENEGLFAGLPAVLDGVCSAPADSPRVPEAAGGAGSAAAPAPDYDRAALEKDLANCIRNSADATALRAWVHANQSPQEGLP